MHLQNNRPTPEELEVFLKDNIDGNILVVSGSPEHLAEIQDLDNSYENSLIPDNAIYKLSKWFKYGKRDDSLEAIHADIIKEVENRTLTPDTAISLSFYICTTRMEEEMKKLQRGIDKLF